MADLVFIYTRDGLRFIWHGGEYCDIYLDTEPPAITDMCINFWDYDESRPTIERTHKAFAAAVDLWCGANDEEVARVRVEQAPGQPLAWTVRSSDLGDDWRPSAHRPEPFPGPDDPRGPRTYTTKSGTKLTEDDLRRLADEAERGYCVAIVETADHRVRCFRPLPCPIHGDDPREEAGE